MYAVTRRGAVLLAAVLLAGCATGLSFSNVQSDFKRVQDARAQCRGTAEARARCLSTSGKELADIARKARGDAALAADDRTRVGLLRLAAVAGWESGTPEGLDIAYAASTDGIARCDGLPADRFGAPRDCALLRVGPAFVTHLRTNDAVNELTRRLRTQPATPEDRRQLSEIAGSYLSNTYNPVREVQARIARDPTVDASVSNYLKSQITAFACTAGAIVRLTHVARDAAARASISRQMAATVRSDTNFRAVGCGNPIPGQPLLVTEQS